MTMRTSDARGGEQGWTERVMFRKSPRAKGARKGEFIKFSSGIEDSNRITGTHESLIRVWIKETLFLD